MNCKRLFVPLAIWTTLPMENLNRSSLAHFVSLGCFCWQSKWPCHPETRKVTAVECSNDKTGSDKRAVSTLMSATGAFPLPFDIETLQLCSFELPFIHSRLFINLQSSIAIKISFKPLFVPLKEVFLVLIVWHLSKLRPSVGVSLFKRLHVHTSMTLNGQAGLYHSSGERTKDSFERNFLESFPSHSLGGPIRFISPM